MSTRTLIRLPGVMRQIDRDALLRFGFKLRASSPRCTAARLPSSWSQVWMQQYDCFVCFDAHMRERIYVYPQATFTMQGAPPDGFPIEIMMPAIKILHRYRPQTHGDPHFRVFDRVQEHNLSDKDGHIIIWKTSEDAKAWLDAHKPHWDFDPAAYWDDADQLPRWLGGLAAR